MRLGRLKNLRLLCSVVIWHENLRVMVFANSVGSGYKWKWKQSLMNKCFDVKDSFSNHSNIFWLTTELFVLYNLMALFSPSGRCCLLTPRLQHWTRTAAAGTVYSSPVPCRVTVRCHLHLQLKSTLNCSPSPSSQIQTGDGILTILNLWNKWMENRW